MAASISETQRVIRTRVAGGRDIRDRFARASDAKQEEANARAEAAQRRQSEEREAARIAAASAADAAKADRVDAIILALVDDGLAPERAGAVRAAVGELRNKAFDRLHGAVRGTQGAMNALRSYPSVWKAADDGAASDC